MRPRGLTIIEMLIAATVFIVAIVTLIGIFPVSARSAQQSHAHLVATNLAEKELELSRAMDFLAVADRDKTYRLHQESGGFAREEIYQVTVRVREIRSGLKSVLVTVKWDQDKNIPRNLSMETFVARLTP